MESNALLDAVKARYSLPSDYALAKLMKCSAESVRMMRERGLSDDRALQCATLLEVNEGEALASVRAERSKNPEVKAAARFRRLRAALGAFLTPTRYLGIPLIAVLSACGGGPGSGAALPEPTLPTNEVWIAGGQSNMAMRQDGVTIAAAGEVPAVAQYFADAMYSAGRPVTISPTAIPSTALDCWRVGGACFEQNIRPLAGVAPAGVIWWQGESDSVACTDSAMTYGARFQQLITEWRAFFGTPELPFLIVQLGKLPIGIYDGSQDCGGLAWAEKWELVKTGQLSAAQHLPGAEIITTSDITLGDTHHPHYAYPEIGARLATAAL